MNDARDNAAPGAASSDPTRISRRDWLQSLVSFPVPAIFVFTYLKKRAPTTRAGKRSCRS